MSVMMPHEDGVGSSASSGNLSGPSSDEGAGDSVVFKLPSEEWEVQQMHKLNYATFTEEIPQYPENRERQRVDKFHDKNLYVVAVTRAMPRRVVGMVCFHGQPPFSVAGKLADQGHTLSDYLPQHARTAEIRLLAVDPGFRKRQVTPGMLGFLANALLRLGFNCVVMSGTLRQLRLYRSLGFTPIGPVCGTSPDAQFQPMILTLQQWRRVGGLAGASRLEQSAASQAAKDAAAAAARAQASAVAPANVCAGNLDTDADVVRSSSPVGDGDTAAAKDDMVSLLPGPVQMEPGVRTAIAEAPVSHRGAMFVADVALARALLCRLTRARAVHLLMGSGTLANECVAAQLSLLQQPGLVLSSGEFGDRLADHAARWRLDHKVIKHNGDPCWITPAAVTELLRQHASTCWIWLTHCETSTGAMVDLSSVVAAAAEHSVRVCVDAISTIGAVPVDLSTVYLASGVSGKALGSYAGLAMVYSNHVVEPSPLLPRYLDLSLYHDANPFTMSSPLVYALLRALGAFQCGQRFRCIARQSQRIHDMLHQLNIKPLVPASACNPAVVTVCRPDAQRVGAALRRRGFLVSYQSRYLCASKSLQVCFMGPGLTTQQLDAFLRALRECLAPGSVSVSSPVLGA